MIQKPGFYFTILLFIIISGCKEKEEKKIDQSITPVKTAQTDSSAITEEKTENPGEEPTKDDNFVLTDDNAIPFFFDYSKKHQEHKVKVTTKFGSFIIDLYKETPYHRANFIYLTRKGYFNGTYFHRVVRDFVIQGGNSDNMETSIKRSEIGKYLLPPDTRKGFRHDRGTVSMPSSDDVSNPHKLASPYEFFIVVTKPGSYHLDGGYTPFGKVIEGMDVVDKINAVPTDESEWPVENIIMQVEILE